MDIEAIRQEFEKWNEDDDFSGVFSMRRDGRVEIEQAYGYADFFEQRPNRTDTSMGIASGTKLFTALTVLRLAEEGRLSIEQPIGEILDIEFGNIHRSITVRQLLTHTSGVADYFYEFEGEDFEDLWKNTPVNSMERVADFLPLFNHRPPRFAPGEKTEYCDSGFLLLGLAVEKASGKKYQDAAAELVIDPCGLNNTGFYYADRLPKNTALGYMYDEKIKQLKSNIFAIPIVGGPDGGVYTNARDIERLWSSLFHGNLLSQSTKSEMLKPHTRMPDMGKNVCYGLGIYIIEKEAEPPRYCIVGGDPGVEFFSIYQPDTRTVVSVLGNTGKNTWPLFAAISGW